MLIRDVTVVDCTGREPQPNMDVEVLEGKIGRVASKGSLSSGVSVDAAGLTLMPGLTDAHVHLALIHAGGGHGSDPWVDHVLHVKDVIEGTLQEGFTTVRDAGGLEPAFAHTVERGRIRGPRILPSGSVLSQTGGHGDLRAHHEAVAPGVSIPGLVARPEVVDGVTEVKRAAREQLRRGARQIKLMTSGGVLSPTDPFDSIQFTVDEIAAAVEVARTWGTYVLAHCHTSPAINNALDGGAHSIEHSSIVDEETAERMAREDAFAIITLQVMEELMDDPTAAGLTESQISKLQAVGSQKRTSIDYLQAAGGKLGSGSDLVGPDQKNRGREIVLMGELIGAHQAIISATRTNAELFRMDDRIGTIEEGKYADLILVDGNPVDDITVLGQPEKIRAVVRGGEVCKDIEGRFA